MRTVVVATAIGMSVIGLSTAADSQAAIRRTDIPAQALRPALQRLSEDRDLQLVFRTDVVGEMRTGGAVGELTTDEALTQLLSGTGLGFRYLDEKTVTVFQLDAATHSSGSGGQQNSVRATDGQKNEKAEAKESFWQRFRVAQAAGPAPQAADSARSQERVELEEILVTGSRLRIRGGASAGPMAVHTYSREQIERSGQTTAAGFLDSIPQVSIAGGDSSNGGFGANTVRLRGLPHGTTLILINGRRIVSATSAQLFSNYFDLNAIPLAAVERIEVLPEAASAAYGSGAMGGVVNFVLREDFSGLEARLEYGAASDGATDDSTASLAWGHAWDRAALSVIATYQKKSELSGGERDLAASDDFTAYGGADLRRNTCFPGNVFSLTGAPLPGLGATSAGVPSTRQQGVATQADFAPTAGVLNRCTTSALTSLIPPSERTGLLLSGTWNLSPQVEGFIEALLSHETRTQYLFYPSLSAVVPAANPFNPFGQSVRVTYAFSDFGRGFFDLDSDFARPVLGLRGRFNDDWEWEVVGWGAFEHSSNTRFIGVRAAPAIAAVNSTDPATALNLFIAGPPASTQVLAALPDISHEFYDIRTVAGSALVRGPLWQLPAGALSSVLGVEYFADELSFNTPFNAQTLDNTRNTRAAFGEARIPLVAGRDATSEERLALWLAGRYDDYSDRFGAKSTGQAGVEWRPLRDLLVRGNLGTSFRAPSLFQSSDVINASFPQSISDPRRGNSSATPLVTQGGNLDLEPESGTSRSFGLTYRSDAITWMSGLELTATYWSVDLEDQITTPDAQTIVNNESLFPDRVVRQAGCPGDPLSPFCPIASVNTRFINISELELQGMDYALSWRHALGRGVLTPELAATNTFRYRSVLSPGAPERDFVSRADFAGYAPRWKGTASLNWDIGSFNAYVAARYVGSYLDYAGVREIGNQWITDLSLGFSPGKSSDARSAWLPGMRLSLGVVNLFDEAPQFASSGTGGYDAQQADLRGRFIHGAISVRW